MQKYRYLTINKDEFVILIFILGLMFFDNGTVIMRFLKTFLFFYALLKCFRKGMSKVDKYVMWMCSFLIYSSLSILWAKYTDVTVEASFTLLLNCLCLWALYSLITINKSRISDKLKIILRWIPAFSIFFFVRMFIEHGFALFSGARNIEAAASSMHNNMGAYAAISISIAFFSLISKKIFENRFLCYIALFANIFILVISGSRKSVLYALIPIVIILIMRSNNPLKVLRNIMVSLGIVAVSYYLTMNYDFFYSLLGNGIRTMVRGMLGLSTDESTAGRLRVIEWGLQIYKEHTWFGIGLEGFKMQHMSSYGVQMIADNNYIELLVDLGAFGLVIYYSFYFVVIKKLIRKLLFNRNIYYVFSFALLISIIICDYGCCSYKDLFIQILLMIIFIITRYGIDNELPNYDN